MTEPFSTILIVSGAVLLGGLFWAFTLALTYFDLSRRNLPAVETFAWLALVALIPLVGFLAYLFARLLNRIFSSSHSPIAEVPGRVTRLKSPFPAEASPSTILGRNLISPTILDGKSQRNWGLYGSPNHLFDLKITEGPHAGKVLHVDELPACIGRGPEVAIALDEDRVVSRRHAEIYQQAGVLHIRDLDSTHGTYVNEYRIEDRSLVSGDQIRVGSSVLQFERRER